MNHIVCCSPISHLLCSPHQEWNSLWWISTKRFETYKERQFSQVCYLKPGNLGIQFTHRGEPAVFIGLTRISAVHWNRGSGGYPVNNWPHLKTQVIASLIPTIPSLSRAREWECTVTVDQDLPFPWVTHLITAASSLIPNSVGRACQTAYAERRGDFEMLLMTLGYNSPLSFTPTLSFFLVHSCLYYSRSCSFFFTASLWICRLENTTQSRVSGNRESCLFFFI